MGSKTRKKGPAHKRKKPSRRQDACVHLLPSTKSGYDRHHLLFPSYVWRETPAGRELREHKNCVAEVPQFELHDIIHNSVESVPYPGDTICQLAFMEIKDLKPDHETSSKKDLFLAKTQALVTVFDKLGASDTAAALSAQVDAFSSYRAAI